MAEICGSGNILLELAAHRIFLYSPMLSALNYGDKLRAHALFLSFQWSLNLIKMIIVTLKIKIITFFTYFSLSILFKPPDWNRMMQIIFAKLLVFVFFVEFSYENSFEVTDKK